MNRIPKAAAPARAPAAVRAVFAEPLVQFFLIGAAIFAAMLVLKGQQRPVVRIDRQELGQLAAYWEGQMERPPTKSEMDGLIRDRVDEEILSREAMRLGLDKNDMIIRRRLAQKMAFASEDTAQAAEPTEPQLAAYFETHRGDYQTPSRVAMRQLFFSQDRGEEAARAAADQALAALKAGKAAEGDPSVLPLTYADVTLEQLARDYGPGFDRTVAQVPVGIWAGPVQSAYGWHVVLVQSRGGVVTPPFEQVRAEVREAVIAERRRAANQAYLERLRRRYRVEVTGATGAR